MSSKIFVCDEEEGENAVRVCTRCHKLPLAAGTCFEHSELAHAAVAGLLPPGPRTISRAARRLGWCVAAVVAASSCADE